MPKVVRCPNCHAPLTVEDTTQAVIHCQYCGYDAKQTMYAQPRPAPAAPAPAAPAQMTEQGRRTLKIVLIVIVATSVLPLFALPAIFCGMGSVTTTILKTTTQPVVVSSSGGPFGPGGLNIRKAPVEQDSEPEADRLLAAKLELASECLNRFSADAFRARARYLGWLPDPRGGPTCSEKCINWGVTAVNVDSGADSDLAKLLAAKQPPLPFDSAVPRYLAALTDLGKVSAEAHRYYDQKDYKEDACKKGQELHAKLIPLFESLEKSDGEIRAVLDRDLPALWARRLKLVEREDPGGQLARSLALLIESRRLVDLIRDREAGRGGDGADTAFRAQLQRFGETIDKSTSGREGKPLDHPKWIYRVDSWVQSAAVELQKVAKEYARGELHSRIAAWQRMPEVIRRHHSPPDALSPVQGKYNEFLRHLRGAGVSLLVADHQRCL